MYPWEMRNSCVLKETLLPHLTHAGGNLLEKGDQPEDVWVPVMPCYYDLCGPSSCEVFQPFPLILWDSPCCVGIWVAKDTSGRCPPVVLQVGALQM